MSMFLLFLTNVTLRRIHCRLGKRNGIRQYRRFSSEDLLENSA